MQKRAAGDLLQELEQKTAELEELKQRVHAANGGVKRARSGANNQVLIVDGGETFRPPGVYGVAWEDSPFHSAPVPKKHKQYWIAMTGQTDPTEYGSDDDEGEDDFEDEDGVRVWSIISMCRDLGITDAAPVHEWLDQKKFVLSGKALLHPKNAAPLHTEDESVMTLFVSTDLEQYETQ